MSDFLLQVKDLRTSFFTDSGEVKAINGISFDLPHGKVLGIVGESGSGKSVTAYSIMQILSFPGKVVGGEVLFHGEDLLKKSEQEMRDIRGKKISMIFQDPMTSLNPVYTIGNQIEEAIKLHTDRRGRAATEHAERLLSLVGINEPARRLRQYPFEFSGGMRQRAMIAMALACEPDLLIADEPTTALDVTIQAQIIELIQELQKKLHMAVIMITHDLGVIADICDEIIVMYAGSICERGEVDDIFYNPKHAYTRGLLQSIPKARKSSERLNPIAGTPIDLLNLPPGCPFAPRCKEAMKICLQEHADEIHIGGRHYASCWVNAREIMGVPEDTGSPETGEIPVMMEPQEKMEGGDNE